MKDDAFLKDTWVELLNLDDSGNRLSVGKLLGHLVFAVAGILLEV